MTKVNLNGITRVQKETTLLVAIIFIVLVGELLIFNRGIITDHFLELKEQHFTVQDAALHQVELKNGKLFVRGDSPKIIFNNIDLPVDRISIACTSTNPNERGQVFFRAAQEDFTWAKSLSFETSSNTQIVDLPAIPMVSSFRFDLSRSENAVITCSEFVINPPVSFQIRFRRLAIYLVFLLLSTFELIKKLSSAQETSPAAFPSRSFQRLATPLLALCLVFPDVVFLGASLRITDQVYGNRFSFPLISFYPHFSHQLWNAGLSDYGGA